MIKKEDFLFKKRVLIDRRRLSCLICKGVLSGNCAMGKECYFA